MTRRVAIVTAVQTKFNPNRRDVSIGELIWEVVGKILQETGLKFEAQIEGKKGLVIMVACMRKLLRMLNAILREQKSWKNPLATT